MNSFGGRGLSKFCDVCAGKHWSQGDEPTCPSCRRLEKHPMLGTGMLGRPTEAVRRAASYVPRGGRCLTFRRCAMAHWRNLNHRHCRCGRPMAERADMCGACTALILLEQLLDMELAAVLGIPVQRFGELDPTEMRLEDMQFSRAGA